MTLSQKEAAGALARAVFNYLSDDMESGIPVEQRAMASAVLAYVTAAKEPDRCPYCDGSGILRSVGWDNEEIISDCLCAARAQSVTLAEVKAWLATQRVSPFGDIKAGINFAVAEILAERAKLSNTPN